MKFTLLLLPVVILVFVTSCAPEPTPTPAEKLGDEISKVAREQGIIKADVYEKMGSSYQIRHFEDPFTIDGQFVRIFDEPESYYNMARVVQFKVSNAKLVLYIE